MDPPRKPKANPKVLPLSVEIPKRSNKSSSMSFGSPGFHKTFSSSSLLTRLQSNGPIDPLLLDENSKKLFPLQTDSTFRKCWEVTMMLTLVYVSIMLPFTMAYIPEPGFTLRVINRIVDALFWLDIVLNFVSAFENEEGETITDYKTIGWRYVTSPWFTLDVVSTFPFDDISSAGSARMTKILKTVRIIKVTKMLRLGKLKRIYQAFRLRFDITNTHISIIKYSMIIICFSHWFACITFALARMANFRPSSWINVYLESLGDPRHPQDLPVSSQYIISFYWSITIISTVGYGDIIARTDIERGIACLLMLIGGGSFAYAITNICASFLDFRMSALLFAALQDGLKDLFNEKEVSADLNNHVRYYLLHKHHHSSIDMHDEFTLLAHLSDKLRYDVWEEYGQSMFWTIHSCRCFGISFIRKISEELEGHVFHRESVIVQEGSKCEYIHFHLAGEIELLKGIKEVGIKEEKKELPEGKKEMDKKIEKKGIYAKKINLIEGGSFNEVGCLIKQKHLMTVFSVGYVEQYLIKREKILKCLDELQRQKYMNILIRKEEQMKDDIPRDFFAACTTQPGWNVKGFKNKTRNRIPQPMQATDAHYSEDDYRFQILQGVARLEAPVEGEIEEEKKKKDTKSNLTEVPQSKVKDLTSWKTSVKQVYETLDEIQRNFSYSKEIYKKLSERCSDADNNNELTICRDNES